jgi:hypothetical protein
MEETAFNMVETVEEVVSSVSLQACEKVLKQKKKKNMKQNKVLTYFFFKGVELISVVDPQIPGFLRGDSRRLRQVLLNFLRSVLFIIPPLFSSFVLNFICSYLLTSVMLSSSHRSGMY